MEALNELLVHCLLVCDRCEISVNQVMVSAGGSWPNGCYDEPVYKYVMDKCENWTYCEIGSKLFEKAFDGRS